MTLREARQMLRVFQKALGITDWKVEITISDDPPRWALGESCPSGSFGRSLTFRDMKKADIWLCPCLHDRNSESIQDTLIHEILHVAQAEENNEFFINRIASILLRDYNAHNRPPMIGL